MDNGREDKNPWDKWYWQDYETDTGLRSCSLQAQGLWMRLLCYMARNKIKGYLLDGDRPMDNKTIAKLVGETEKFVSSLVNELRSHGVMSQTAEGLIYNRRMARESSLSAKRSEAGKRGMETRWGVKQNDNNPITEGDNKTITASASVYASSLSSSLLKEEEGIKGIVFSFESREWVGISDRDKGDWAKAYLACDVGQELNKMAQWLLANPEKRKVNYRRFIVNWLNKAQDRGGSGAPRIYQKQASDTLTWARERLALERTKKAGDPQ